MTKFAGSRRVQSVDRAFDVLDVLASGPQRISDIAEATGTSKAAVHHILATLEARRIVAQERDSFRYRLAWGIYELGAKVLRDAGLNTLVAPSLSALAEAVGETTLFNVEDSGSSLVLMRGESKTSTLVANNAPGKRVPLHATASGKVMLAFKPSVLETLPEDLPRFTPRTIVSRHALAAQVERVRQRGYATSWDEHEVALSSLAVPLFDRNADFMGSLTIAAPSGRLNRRSFRTQLQALLSARDEIHALTGGSPQLQAAGL
jgi:IclR family transcriptional regulator, acetate operon repressor